MAGFKTHITTSTVIGIAGGAASAYYFQVPIETSILAAGLCGVAGMMPDLDSGPGRPLRESLAFAAAVVPMMCVDRFKTAGMSLETIILVGGAMYLFIRFGVAWMLRHYTVHRGMFHSIPAALIAGEITFLAFGCERLDYRFFVAGAVVTGFMSHLILDEIWSIDFHRGLPRLKSSFGTAIKFWGDSMWANISTYAKVVVLTFVVVNDQEWMNRFGPPGEHTQQIADRWLNRLGFQNNEPPKTLNIPTPETATVPTDGQPR
jgi:membrane-bound metal-dependent hydrolase YbcI (DUF457 family)